MTDAASLPVEDWRALALQAPRLAAPCGVARLRQTAEDFRVEEQLGFEPAGAGSHLLLQVEKREANTAWVAGRLAAEAGVRVQEVGYAGIKDRRAVTRQWFSVPARKRSAESWQGFSGEGFVVCRAALHARKLPRGALRGNRFQIVLRAVQGERAVFEARLAQLAQQGIANYFGPQRFGREAGNLQALWSVVSQQTHSGAPPESRGGARRGSQPQAWLISTARSLMFNAVLAERVLAGDWNRLSPGERANLDGSNANFLVEAVDPVLQDRLARLDIHPTGPLAGRSGAPLITGAMAVREAQVLAAFSPVDAWLQAAGVEAARRPLRARLEDLQYRWLEEDGLSLELAFGLRAGSYATALLRELIEFDEPLPEGAE